MDPRFQFQAIDPLGSRSQADAKPNFQPLVQCFPPLQTQVQPLFAPADRLDRAIARNRLLQFLKFKICLECIYLLTKAFDEI